jgi:hypothetical protein
MGSSPPVDTACGNAGSVFVYARSGGNWQHHAYLKAINTIAGIDFGWSVAVYGNRIVVGTLNDGNNTATVIQNGTPITNNQVGLGYGAITLFNGL